MKENALVILGIAGAELSATEKELFTRLQPAGYILFTRNIVTPEQTRRLTDSLRELSEKTPIIGIDQEGGRVTRTKEIAPVAPSAPALARAGNPKLISRSAWLTGDLLRLLGVNMDFGPVLDIDHFPEAQNALRGRCWGVESQSVIDGAGTWNRALRKAGVVSCAKHFPACGRAESDPHFDLPSSSISKSQLLSEDIIPYTALMPELDAIMLAHVDFPELDPDFPASLSAKVIREFLRGQLGFEKHFILTDDLDMGAINRRYGRGQDAKLAIEAGNDVALICHEIATADIAVAAIEELPASILEESRKRLERLRKKLKEPMLWSEKQWQTTCDAIQALAQEVPEIPLGELDFSPVAKY